MDTAYKTRAFWMLRALDYALDAIVGRTYNGATACGEQVHIWNTQAAEAGRNAVAPADSECLTRIYVDRQGCTLPA